VFCSSSGIVRSSAPKNNANGPTIYTFRTSLWLGHESTESTEVYLHADMRLKERALARVTPSGLVPGRYRPPDPVLAFLEAL
jgi:hypothetical protein